jgi:uncharacterized protein YecE (DUF72 family)
VTGRVRIGCSGWQYRHWRGDFYPAELAQRLWLDHYVRHFDTVEINNTFYRLPEARTFAAWRDRVPRGFLFAVKASRYLTHMRKLKDPEAPLDLFFERALELRDRFGPVLYQLPPGWKKDVARLEAFVDRLPRSHLHAVEFREPSWYADDVFAVLDRKHVALCLHDMPGSATVREQIGGFVYMRFHGSGARYGGGYPRAHLAGWARWIDGVRDDTRGVFVYFNNDVGGHAPRDAVTLRSLAGVRPPAAQS